MGFLKRHQGIIISAGASWLLSSLWAFGLTFIAIPSRIPQNAVMILISSLCFLPVALLLAWTYLRLVLDPLGKKTLLWRLTVVPMIALLMTGVVLVAAIRGGNAPIGPFITLDFPKERLQVSGYSSNGNSDPTINEEEDSGEDNLLVAFRRFSQTVQPAQSPGVEAEANFEAGVLLGTGPHKDLNLTGYDVLSLEVEVTSRLDREVPPIGFIIKDESLHEIKLLSMEPYATWEDGSFRAAIPLSLFSKLSLEKIDLLGFFVRDLRRGERLHLKFSEIRFE